MDHNKGQTTASILEYHCEATRIVMTDDLSPATVPSVVHAGTGHP
jgi:hypothetical protein